MRNQVLVIMVQVEIRPRLHVMTEHVFYLTDFSAASSHCGQKAALTRFITPLMGLTSGYEESR